MTIFLSYAEEDHEVADLIARKLTGDGHDLFDWHAPERRGRRFKSEIERGIRGADAFIALLSPSFLTSDWCNREVEMAIQREKDLQSKDPSAMFIHVVMVVSVPGSDAGVLIGYDWLHMTGPEQQETELAALCARFDIHRTTAHASQDTDAGDFRPPDKPESLAPDHQEEPVFRNREDEIHKVILGLTNSGGPHFWLVVAPPQLGKTWFLNRLANDRAMTAPTAWVVRLVDMRLVSPRARTRTGELLALLFGLPSAAKTDPEALLDIARTISGSGRPHLCLLDSAELLSEETAEELRACLSEIYRLVKTGLRRGVRLAFIVASRQEGRSWKGVVPRPRFSPLPLTQFTVDVVWQALSELAIQMKGDVSPIELANYAQLVHRLTEGLPELLVQCLRWIRAQEGVDIARLATAKLFEQLVHPYVKEKLLTWATLFPPDQPEADEPLQALVHAYRVLVPYRLFTHSHLRHHLECDTAFRSALEATQWGIEDLWAAIDDTSLLRRCFEEPWQEIQDAIRRLLYRYFYRNDDDRAEAQYEACKFVEQWADGQIGKEQAVGLVECLWHESNTLTLRGSGDIGQPLIESARRLSINIQGSFAYRKQDIRKFAVDRMRGDEEFQDAVGSEEILNRLAGVVTRPEES